MSIFPQHSRLSIFQQHTTQLVKHREGAGNAHRIVNKAAHGNQRMGNLSSEPLCAFYSWCVVSSRNCCASIFWKGSSLLHKDEGRICWSYGNFRETWSLAATWDRISSPHICTFIFFTWLHILSFVVFTQIFANLRISINKFYSFLTLSGWGDQIFALKQV